jgi:putative ABC transport system permease protein
MIISPRWRKVTRDLWDNKARTILVVVAIAVGVFAFGGMFATHTILLDNMSRGFEATNQATLTISLQPFNESLVRTVSNFPYVQQVEARTTPQVQVWTGSSWRQIELISMPNYETMEINRITLEQGTLFPKRRELILERQSLPLVEGAEVGDTVLIELPDSTQKELEIVGVVHDFSAVPGGRFPQLTGYVSLDTLKQFGLSENYDELLIITDPELTTQAELEIAAEEITDLLERYGYAVGSVQIAEPGEHWATDFITAMILILVALGIMALALSGFLIINTITAILSQQKRQVGMMKAVGARTGDVMGIYMTMSVAFGVLSLLIALPISVVLSYVMTGALANFLNINILSFHFPTWVFVAQMGIAVVTPLFTAFFPILSGTKTTVREAVSDYGITSTKGGMINRLLATIRGLPRPIMLSLRNTFRRKGRLALTMITLTIAGAIFISILSTRNSLIDRLSQFLNIFGYDVQVTLTSPEQISRLSREALRIDGVEKVEGWGGASGTIIRPDGIVIEENQKTDIRPNRRTGQSAITGGVTPNQASPEEGTVITILAPPPDTTFIEPDIIEGRWLELEDYAAIVLSSETLQSEPYITVGDEIKVDFGDKQRSFIVVGIINLVGADLAYAPYSYITRLNGAAGLASVAMMETTHSDQVFQETVSRNVEDHFQDIGIGVSQTMTPADTIGVMSSQINFLIVLMLFMAGLLAVVGGLGLASTMGLNVLERTREIGVLRAVGAANGSVRGIFLTEGLIIGLLSGLLALILSIPLSYALSIALGNALFQQPFDLVLKPSSFLLWLVIALVIAAVASLLPANRATQISVRESISYE